MGKHAQNYNYTVLLHLCSILTCWTHERWINILTVSTGSSVHSVFCLCFLALHCGSIEPHKTKVFFLYFLTHPDVGDYFTESCYEYIVKNLIWLRIHVFSLFYLNSCTRLHTSMENCKWITTYAKVWKHQTLFIQIMFSHQQALHARKVLIAIIWLQFSTFFPPLIL